MSNFNASFSSISGGGGGGGDDVKIIDLYQGKNNFFFCFQSYFIKTYGKIAPVKFVNILLHVFLGILQ